MFAAGYQPGVDLRYGTGMLWQAGPLTATLQNQTSDTSHEAWRSEDSMAYYAALEPRWRMPEALRESSAEPGGSLWPESSECEWDFDCDWEELEQLQLKLSRYASGSDSAQLGSSASPLAAATMLHGEAHSPEWTTSDISTTSIFDDLFFEPLSGPSSPPSADYHDFVQGFVLSPVSDSLVTAQQPIEQQQHPSPPNMAPAAPPASDVHQKMDEVNIGDLFMEADALGADTPGHAGLPHLPQQVPTAASLPVLDQTGSTQLDIRRHSPSPDPIHQTHTRESPPPQAGVSIISPALSQTIGMGRPTRKRRSEDVSMVSQPTTGPTLTPSGTETARLRPAKRQKATSTDANQKKVPAVTPARKRAAKRAARPASPFPELSQVEIAQAKADGMVWAKIGSYDAWPAQVQQPTAEQTNLLPRLSRTIPTGSSFVMFCGRHDFNVVSHSRITVSFEDGLRRCKAKRGSTLSNAVSEAVNFIKARAARVRHTPALIG